MPDNLTPSQFAWFWLFDGILLLVVVAVSGLLIATHRARQPAVVFLLRLTGVFALLFGLDLLLMWLVPSLYHSMQTALAKIVTWAVNIGGLHAITAGRVITTADSTFTISAPCLGDEFICTYTALVLAERGATKKQYVWGIAGGLLALAVFNVFRIAASIYFTGSFMGINTHQAFYAVNLIAVMVVWAVWFYKVKPRIADLQ